MENRVVTTEGAKKVYPSIDLMKFVLAFFVVGIHARSVTLVDYPPVIWYFCSFAVSYFFIASGFFFRAKWLDWKLKVSEDLSGIRQFIKRILQLFLIWSLLYLPTEIYILANNEHSVVADGGLFLIDFLFRGKVGFGITLWYLHSTLVGGGIIYLLARKRMSFRGMLIIAVCLYVGSYFLDRYLLANEVSSLLFRIKQVFGNNVSRLFSGFFLLLVGGQMNVYKEKLTFPVSLSVIAVSVLMFAYNIPFSSIVSAVGFMCLTVSCPMPMMSGLTRLRNYSILIYLLHMFFIMMLAKCFAIHQTWLIWAVAFLLSFLIAHIIIRSSDKINWLKKMY